MKKTLLNLLLALIGTLSLNATDFTFTYEGKTLTYTVIDVKNKYVSTKTRNQVSGDLIIPEKVKYGSTEYTVTEIESSSFRGCSSMTSISIPESVTSIGRYAFYGCSGLKSVTIPKSVTSLGFYVFGNCTGLTSIALPESVTSLGSHTFWGCTGLVSIDIPESVTTIDDYTFYGCTGLTSIIIPESVTTLGGHVFYCCTGLTSVSLPSTLKELGGGVWDGCEGIMDVYCASEVPVSASEGIFSESVYENATLHVPDNCLDIYMATNPWSLFFNIIEGDNDEGNGDDLAGIEQIETNGQDVINYSEPYDLYNIYGCFVGRGIDDLTPGFYIIRQGHTTKKITIQ